MYPSPMDQKVNLEEKFSLLDKPYSPGIVGYVNELQAADRQGRRRVRLAQSTTTPTISFS